MSVCVRFAPSPTGFLHVGSARTALFNWLFARHEGGKFLLRIEDTDAVRSKKEFLEEILDSLRWLGLQWDGEVEFQSRRFDLYRQKAQGLLKSGAAYEDGKAVVFKVTPGEIVTVQDLIHGPVQFNTLEIKDQVLIKSDGTPTYSFACVIDDSEFGITHVIRGDDHLSNTPKQILLYRALGLTVPTFVHIPLILGADRSRLSKRHGATNLNDYRRQGYLPEAMVNFLSLLGWSPGGDRELMPVEEIIKEFDLARIGKTGAVFDLKKLTWMNSQYLAKASLETLLPLVQKALRERGWWTEKTDPAWVGRVIETYKSRVETIEDFCRQTQGLFTDEIPFDGEAVQARLKQPNVGQQLTIFAQRLDALETWETQAIEKACRELAADMNLKAADLIHPTRVAVTGRAVGPSLFHVLEVAGKQKTVARLKNAASALCAI
ncbi:MAG: glutamate--tRNA ligase [Candidatus Omnitrophica bacterium]|nr:glutamate--tRNA ligase [Candidatus Omnitrophota bacterium]